MNIIKFTSIQKVERAKRPDKYYVWFQRLNCSLTSIEVDFKQVEPLILDLHALGILGQRRYSSLTDSHLTEWFIPNI